MEGLVRRTRIVTCYACGIVQKGIETHHHILGCKHHKTGHFGLGCFALLWCLLVQLLYRTLHPPVIREPAPRHPVPNCGDTIRTAEHRPSDPDQPPRNHAPHPFFLPGPQIAPRHPEQHGDRWTTEITDQIGKHEVALLHTGSSCHLQKLPTGITRTELPCRNITHVGTHLPQAATVSE